MKATALLTKQHEEEDLFPHAEKALGEGSEALGEKMKNRFEATKNDGYRRALGKGGAVVNSASAPEESARP